MTRLACCTLLHLLYIQFLFKHLIYLIVLTVRRMLVLASASGSSDRRMQMLIRPTDAAAAASATGIDFRTLGSSVPPLSLPPSHPLSLPPSVSFFLSPSLLSLFLSSSLSLPYFSLSLPLPASLCVRLQDIDESRRSCVTIARIVIFDGINLQNLI